MNADQYRARAGDLERQAETVPTADLRAEYQKLARAWRDLANTADDQHRREKPGRGA